MTDPVRPRPARPAVRSSRRSAFLQKKASLFGLPQWNDWEWHVLNRISTAAELGKWITLTSDEKRALQLSAGSFGFSITPYWASLMDPGNYTCPIRRQTVPALEEMRPSTVAPRGYLPDQMKVAGGRLTSSGRGIARLSIHSRCAVVCRFCPQKAGSGPEDKEPRAAAALSDPEWAEARRYLAAHPEISEVVLSGGEPLLLNDDLLWRILKGLRSVDSVKTLRVETRILSHLPQRVTESLVAALKDCGPVWFQAGVNHPEEITGEFAEAAAALADAGIPLLSETVLLKDINDRPRVLADLFSSLHRLRIRPAQLIHCLPVPGGDHLRTSVSAGLRLMQVLRGALPEPSLPEYAAETFGGRIPLRGESVLSRTPRRVLLRNSDGRIYVYPEKFFSFSA